MQLNQLNLADIRAFVLIAKLGNFTKAAEELEVSRSHVSRQLSQLENSMGVTLVIRTHAAFRSRMLGNSSIVNVNKP